MRKLYVYILGQEENKGKEEGTGDGPVGNEDSQENEVHQERIGFEKIQQMHAEMMQAKELEHKQEVEMLKRQLEEARRHKELKNGPTGDNNIYVKKEPYNSFK